MRVSMRPFDSLLPFPAGPNEEFLPPLVESWSGHSQCLNSSPIHPADHVLFSFVITAFPLTRSFIPGGNNIYLSCYSIHRDPRYFSPEPDNFWPDRWLPPLDRCDMSDPSRPLDPDTPVIHDLDAYLPFSYGTRVCVGKTLAQMEMRVVVASVVQKFDMEMADGYDIKQWDKDLQDFYVFSTGPLPIRLTERQ